MSAVRIGPYTLQNGLVLAPMAGVTDQPFRQLCKRLGAGLVVSEMVSSDMSLWNTRKSRLRMIHEGDPEPRSVQIAGGDAQMLAQAARANVELGAQIIDINMGCPAKKVCNKAAGSALLKDEALVTEILQAVVAAVDVPVTLKIRTGWDRENKNGLTVAKIAEQAGITALAVHGRTRADLYTGEAEYDTIAAIKQAVSMPVFANGDVDSPEKARYVLDATGADGLLIGRAAQGRPWPRPAPPAGTGVGKSPAILAQAHRILDKTPASHPPPCKARFAPDAQATAARRRALGRPGR